MCYSGYESGWRDSRHGLVKKSLPAFTWNLHTPPRGDERFLNSVPFHRYTWRSLIDNAWMALVSNKPGRNDPCPCGSGKKHKHCCGAPGAQPRVPRADTSAVRRVVSYLNSDAWREVYDAAIPLYLPEELIPREPSEDLLQTINENLHEWLLSDYVTPEGANVIDDYLARRGWRETSTARAWLEQLRKNRLSLYEVQRVAEGEGMALKDRLRGGDPVWVTEKMASYAVQRWDCLVTRLVPQEGALFISGASLPIVRDLAEALVETFQSRMAERTANPTAEDWDRLLQQAGPEFMHCYLSQFRRPLPELATTDGDALIFCTMGFEFPADTREGVIAALRALPDVDGDSTNGKFIWVNPDGTVLATITLDAARGELFAQSKARLDAAQALLREHLPEQVRYLPAVIEDPWQAAGDFDGEIEPQDPALLDAMHDCLDDYYEDWLDTAIPALSGKTPRKAVRSKKGREQVVELLKQMEQMEARKPPEEQYDFLWLWDELGLEPPYDTEEENGLIARAALMEIVNNQLNENNPPAVREAYHRLKAAGHAEDEIMEMIAAALIDVIFPVMRDGMRFDEARYIKALGKLPELPW